MARGITKLEDLPFRGVNMAEEVILRFSLEDEVQNFRRAEVLVQNTIGWVVNDQDINTFRDVFFGYSCVTGYGAYRDAAKFFNGILQDDYSFRLELPDNCIGLVNVKREFMVARDKDFPLSGLCSKPLDEIVVFSVLEIVFHGVSGADENVRILRHLQTVMVAMGVGEGKNVQQFVNQ